MYASYTSYAPFEIEEIRLLYECLKNSKYIRHSSKVPYKELTKQQKVAQITLSKLKQHIYDVENDYKMPF